MALRVRPKTVGKGVKGLQAEGAEGLRDRASRPHRLHRPTPEPIVKRIGSLRRERRTGQQIAAEAGVSPATVSRVPRRLGLNKLKALEPAEPVRRSERDQPGEIIDIDIKKLGKFSRTGHRITGDRKGQSNTRGVPWTADGFRTGWRKTCQKAGIIDLHFHDLRGTTVTRLLALGYTQGQMPAITGH